MPLILCVLPDFCQFILHTGIPVGNQKEILNSSKVPRGSVYLVADAYKYCLCCLKHLHTIR